MGPSRRPASGRAGRQVAPWVLGRDVSDINESGDLFDSVFENEHKFPGTYICRAYCGDDYFVAVDWGVLAWEARLYRERYSSGVRDSIRLKSAS